jgi:putative redox protein
MASASIRWAGGQTYIGTDSTNHSVVLSTPGDGVGMKPSELLLVALCSCSAVDVVEILEKKRLKLTGLEISASAEQEKEAPWTFRKIHLIYKLKGKALSEKAVEQAITLSEDKYCSVAATLRGEAEITFSYEIVNEE